MATKAERFRAETERAAARAVKNALSAGNTAGPSRAAKATVALETTPALRKSTRKSKHRQKAATPLTSKTLLITASPHHRHERG